MSSAVTWVTWVPDQSLASSSATVRPRCCAAPCEHCCQNSAIKRRKVCTAAQLAGNVGARLHAARLTVTVYGAAAEESRLAHASDIVQLVQRVNLYVEAERRSTVSATVQSFEVSVVYEFVERCRSARKAGGAVHEGAVSCGDAAHEVR